MVGRSDGREADRVSREASTAATPSCSACGDTKIDCPTCGYGMDSAASTELAVRRLLTQFALWMSPTWDPHNADDCAAAGVAVAVFLEERDDVNPKAVVSRV